MKNQLITLLLFCIPLMAQTQTTEDSPTIKRVRFEGLKKTKESYLRQILDHAGNDVHDLRQIDQNIQHLRNLSNVAFAAYRIDSSLEQTTLIFKIEEARTLFPILNFGGIQGNFWFQVGFTDFNFLGRGMQLSSFYQNNDSRDNFSLFFRIPYIRGSRWGGSLSALRWASIEPLYFDEGEVRYFYDNLSFGITSTYEFQLGHRIEFGGSFFVEDYKKTPEQPLENPPGPDQFQQPKILGKIVHQFTRLNYDFFQLNGFYNTLIMETVYNTLDQDWFFIILNDWHYFRTVGKRSNLAARLRLGISNNDDSPFAPFVLDSNINIRGSGNRIDRGTAQVILNLEYRHTVWDQLQGNFAAQVVAFSDLGTWRNPGGELSDLFDSNNFRHFLGGGVRFIYKRAFDTIIRADYGYDIFNFNQHGFVLGIGQYF